MEFLIQLYPWIKALHIISIVAWMAGLFYLPRLFYYHVSQVNNSETGELFALMELRLLKIITTPAMMASWFFGLLLLIIPGVVDLSTSWIWIKIVAVIAMTGFHGWLAAKRKEIQAGTCTVSGRNFKIMNEVPTILLIIIVIMVVVKPF